MLKSFLLSLLFTLSLLAQTNVINIIGGGNSESSDGRGNINGVGSAAAVYHPRALAKSGDNQLLVGDSYGIKKVDIATNTISTLFAFNDSYSSVYDIVVDSSSNIYAAVDFWTPNDGVGCTKGGSFFDKRIYKLSSTGAILNTWGASNCETNPNDNFYSKFSITIDENDVVYAISAYTPDANGAGYGTEHKNIEKLNSDGTFSLFYDLKTLDSNIDAVYAIQYYNSEFYLGSNQKLLRLNVAQNRLTELYDMTGTSESIHDISFDKNGDIYLATGDYIRKVFQHETTYYSSPILGNKWNYFQPSYNIKDDILYTGVDSLNVSGFQLYSAIMINNNLFVADNYNQRIAKISFPSNALPTMHFKDFPTEVKKNVSTYFGVDVNDTDGFVSKVYCDFGDGSGEQEVFHDNYGGSQSSSGNTYIKYTEDGNYNISCSVYDNEGAKTSFSKSLTVGDTCTKFSVEKDQQHVAMKVGDTQYFNIHVCEPVQIFSSDESIATATRSKTESIDEVEVKAISEGNATITVSDKNSAGYIFVNVTEANTTTPVITTSDKNQTIGNITFLEYEPEGYFSWSEANNFCKARGLRLPTMDELIYIWNYNDKVKSPLGFQKDTFYWASEIEADSGSHQACAMDVDCSKKDSWPNSSNGHPKCVVAVNEASDVVTPKGKCNLSLSNFEQYLPNNIQYLQGAKLTLNDNGYLLDGAIWNNGCNRLQDGCDGNGIISKTKCNFLGKVITTEFSVDSDLYAAYWIRPWGIDHYTYYNTHHSWRGGKVIPQNVPLFQVLTIHEDGSWNMKLYKDSLTGELLHSQDGKATEEQRKRLLDDNFVMMFTDNYSGKEASMLIKSLSMTTISGSSDYTTLKDELQNVVPAVVTPPAVINNNNTTPQNTSATGSEIKTFKTTDEGNTEKVDIDLGNKKLVINVPTLSDVFDNGNNGVTVITPINDTLDTRTTINNNGTFVSEINRLLNHVVETTQLLIDLVVKNSTVNADGSSVVNTILGNLNLNIRTDNTAQVTTDYIINGQTITMPTFNSGSKIHVKKSGNDVILEVQTKLTSTLRF